MQFRATVAFAGLVGLLGLTAPAYAVPIVGTIGFSGSVSYDNRMVPIGGGLQCGAGSPGTNPTCGASIIDFAPLAPGGSGAPGPIIPGSGNAIVVYSQSGYFCGVAGGPGCYGLPNDGITGTTTAQIFDLTNDPTAAGAPPLTGPAYAPLGVNLGPAGVSGFIQKFVDPDAGGANPGLHFDLTLVINQGFTCTGLEVSGSCAEGPFVLTKTAAGIRVDFDVMGFFRNGVLGCVGVTCTDEGFFIGGFSTTFTGLDFPTLFQRLDVNGLDIGCGPSNSFSPPCSFDANFRNAEVPEPATLLTFGLGSLVMGMRARRKAKKTQA